MGARYDEPPYDYVDPNTLKWRFDIIGASGVGSDYAEIVGSDSSNELIFRLKQDLPGGATLRIIAAAQHPQGINKTGTVYDTVEAYRELVGGEPPLGDSMLRCECES